MTYLECLEGENRSLKDNMDDIVDRVCKLITDLAEITVPDDDLLYEDIAKGLYDIVKEYGDDNAITDTFEHFLYSTNISLNE